MHRFKVIGRLPATARTVIGHSLAIRISQHAGGPDEPATVTGTRRWRAGVDLASLDEPPEAQIRRIRDAQLVARAVLPRDLNSVPGTNFELRPARSFRSVRPTACRRRDLDGAFTVLKYHVPCPRIRDRSGTMTVRIGIGCPFVSH
jgi:hypothetical protein